MASFFNKGLKWLGRSNPMLAPASLATGSDRPRDLGRSLSRSGAAGATIAGLPLVAAGFGLLGRSGGGGGDGSVDWPALAGYDYPTGKVTPDDIAAAEATKARLRKGVAATAAQRRDLVLRSAARRGLLGSGATQAGLLRVGQDEAAGAERAGALGEELLANMRIGREQFNRQRALTIIGGRLQDASSRRYAGSIRHAAFLNSLLDLSRSSLAALDGTNAGLDSPVNLGEPGPYESMG
jgi:hypothetical protein